MFYGLSDSFDDFLVLQVLFTTQSIKKLDKYGGFS